jgi:hypothetical protein
MAIQQVEEIAIQVQGDGTSTVFTVGFNQLFSATMYGDVLVNPSSIPTSIATGSVSGSLPSCVGSLDGFGNIILTFSSAPTSGVDGQVQVLLYFNSGNLSGTSTAWTTSTALNTTWDLATNGVPVTQIQVLITGTVTAGGLVFEVSPDGANWYTAQGAYPSNLQFCNGTWSETQGNATIQFYTIGYAYLRARLNPVITGSGTITVEFQQNVKGDVSTVVAGVMGTYNTSAPVITAATVASAQLDGSGNLFVNNIRRSQVVPATGNIASTTAATLLAAQGAGIFADLASLVMTCRLGATGPVLFGVTISDGTNSYRFNMSSESTATGGGNPPLSVYFDPPIPAHAANTAWTIVLSSTTDTPSVDYVCTFVKQLAS